MTHERAQIETRFIRGASNGVIAGLLAFPVPWIIGFVVLNLLWFAHGTAPIDRQSDLENMLRGGWLAAYFLSSIMFGTFFASRSLDACSPLRSDFVSVAAVACVALIAFVIVDGILDEPRSKLNPPPRFGAPALDRLVLTVPAIVTGAALAAIRSFASSNTSINSSQNQQEQAEP